MTHHILNLGAGVQSTCLALMSHKGGFENVPRFTSAIFADTGDEPDEVYRHLEWLVREVQPSFPVLIRKKGITLGESLIHGINPVSRRFASIPAFTDSEGREKYNKTKRQCTAEFKIAVVNKAIRSELLSIGHGKRWPKDADVHQYFGLSYDEGSRVLRVRQNLLKEGKSHPHFPLYDMMMTRHSCERWLAAYGMPHKTPRSACVFCPYKSNEEWRRLRDEDPMGWAKAIRIDAAIRDPNSACTRKLDRKLYLHRSCKPLAEAPIEEAESKYEQHAFGFNNECEGMCGR